MFLPFAASVRKKLEGHAWIKRPYLNRSLSKAQRDEAFTVKQKKGNLCGKKIGTKLKE